MAMIKMVRVCAANSLIDVTSDGSSTSFSCEYRQRANVFVELGAKELAGDWLSLNVGGVLHYVLHVYLTHRNKNKHNQSNNQTKPLVTS